MQAYSLFLNFQTPFQSIVSSSEPPSDQQEQRNAEQHVGNDFESVDWNCAYQDDRGGVVSDNFFATQFKIVT